MPLHPIEQRRVAGHRLQSQLGGVPCIDTRPDADTRDKRMPFKPRPYVPPILLHRRGPAAANYENIPHSAAAAAAHQPGRLDRFLDEGLTDHIDTIVAQVLREAEGYLDSELPELPRGEASFAAAFS